MPKKTIDATGVECLEHFKSRGFWQVTYTQDKQFPIPIYTNKIASIRFK